MMARSMDTLAAHPSTTPDAHAHVTVLLERIADRSATVGVRLVVDARNVVQPERGPRVVKAWAGHASRSMRDFTEIDGLSVVDPFTP